MSVKRSEQPESLSYVPPQWFVDLLKVTLPPEGETVNLRGQRFVMKDGIPRDQAGLSSTQKQTSNAFGFKWHKRDTFERPEQLARMREWLMERYGDVTAAAWFKQHGDAPVLLDAGCGGGMSAIELFGKTLGSMRYIGVDVSEAVEVAAARFADRGITAGFLQSDFMAVPLPEASVDLIFAEGVLHHADSTRAAFEALVPLLKTGGRFLFYVYRKKGPIREFTDDFIRAKVQDMDPEDAWRELYSLTHLGKALGDLNVELDVPESVELLEIPAGRINLHRFVYWHVFKAFYREDYTLDEMHHINFDWYAPKNAHRQSPKEVQAWCETAGLEIEREIVEDAGITIIARKRGG